MLNLIISLSFLETIYVDFIGVSTLIRCLIAGNIEILDRF